MTQPFVGEIQMFGFNFNPRDWAFCNGATLPLQQNTAPPGRGALRQTGRHQRLERGPDVGPGAGQDAQGRVVPGKPLDVAGQSAAETEGPDGDDRDRQRQHGGLARRGRQQPGRCPRERDRARHGRDRRQRGEQQPATDGRGQREHPPERVAPHEATGTTSGTLPRCPLSTTTMRSHDPASPGSWVTATTVT